MYLASITRSNTVFLYSHLVFALLSRFHVLYSIYVIRWKNYLEELLTKLLDKFPFLSHIKYGQNEYIGIVQNRDAHCTSFYNYERIKADELKKQFLVLGDVWWWESNRMIPINIFLKQDWLLFRPYLTTFISKDCEIIAGPNVSLSELSKKRTKRRSIQLVKKIN